MKESNVLEPAIDFISKRAEAGSMLLADIVLKKDRDGSSIPVKMVTPAELMFLIADNHAACGGDPIVSIKATKVKKWGKIPDLIQNEESGSNWGKLVPSYTHDYTKEDGKGEPLMTWGWIETDEDRVVDRSSQEEVKRLARKYDKKKVAKLFSGAIPQLPQTFEEARSLGVQFDLTGERFFLLGSPE